ncbi:helix-turn-helix domain-containing protein [Paenibacillus hemerocallicola]|uniref:Helix-turn-helix domain-containing protein n=1 Tax=Paenibacillus hemerocallicola TaxID=1172614 RepID=A0A5C4TC17_9BACL|nr:helix-turn-helix domain-containing protein [Paenibacillus hemerocallicola]
MKTLECEVLAAGYSYHSKPFRSEAYPGLSNYLIRFQSEGRCRAVVDGNLRPVEPGDLLLFKPGDPYELRVEAERQHSGETAVASGDYYFFCRGQWLDEWWAERKRPQLMNLPLQDNMLSVCRQIVLEHYRGKRKYKQIAEHYMRIFCLMVDREMTEHAVGTDGGKSFLAQRMRNYVEEHALESFKLEDVARGAGLSPSRAVHLFKACFGQSIMQYALQIRLSIARERMLYSPMSLEQIAELSGFSSYSYFHRMFRAHYGTSPKRYQQEQMGHASAASAATEVPERS